VSDRCRIADLASPVNAFALDRLTRQTGLVAQTAPPATLDDLVGAALEHHRGPLAALVRERVTALVDELVELELNGRADATEPVLRAAARTTEEPTAMKVCTSCREEKSADKFERHRNVCRACRWQAERERRDRAESPDLPLGGGGSSAIESLPAGPEASSTAPSPI
jgi:hypothetical protein